MEELVNLLPLIIPLVILELGMRVYAIIDIVSLEKKEIKTKGDNPLLWIIIVAIVNFAWLIYFIFGKEE